MIISSKRIEQIAEAAERGAASEAKVLLKSLQKSERNRLDYYRRKYEREPQGLEKDRAQALFEYQQKEYMKTLQDIKVLRSQINKGGELSKSKLESLAGRSEKIKAIAKQIKKTKRRNRKRRSVKGTDTEQILIRFQNIIIKSDVWAGDETALRELDEVFVRILGYDLIGKIKKSMTSTKKGEYTSGDAYDALKDITRELTEKAESQKNSMSQEDFDELKEAIIDFENRVQVADLKR